MGFVSLPNGHNRLLGALAVLAATVLLGFASVGLHFRNTPTFDEYLRTRPVAAERVAELLPTGAEILSVGETWRAGDVDPLVIDASDPTWRVHRLQRRVCFRHGDEPLAVLRQELAVAEDPATGDRHGLALRTVVEQRDPRVRVIARTWVSDEPLVGPQSSARGRLELDVMVVAGAGPDDLAIARLPVGQLDELPRFAAGVPDPLGFASYWLSALAHPGGAPLEEGLVYRWRQGVALCWRHDPGGSQASGAGIGMEHALLRPATYSRALESVTESGALTLTSKSEMRLAWNGRDW